MLIRHLYQNKEVNCPKYNDPCTLCMDDAQTRTECEVLLEYQSVLHEYEEKGILTDIVIDLEQTRQELQSLTSIKDRLNYWQSLMQKKYFEPLQYCQDNWEHKEWIGKHILVQLFGYEIAFFTPLLIPKALYQQIFEKDADKPEFTFWFLQYYANENLSILIEEQEIEEKLASPIAEEFILAELAEIKTIEDRVYQLNTTKKISILTNL